MDWIKARHESSLDQIWTAFRDRVVADATSWGDLQSSNVKQMMEIKTEPKTGVVIIYMKSPFGDDPNFVRFEKSKGAIAVLKRGEKKPTLLIPKANAKGKRRLLHGEAELKLWQASQFCLDPLLFLPEA